MSALAERRIAIEESEARRAKDRELTKPLDFSNVHSVQERYSSMYAAYGDEVKRHVYKMTKDEELAADLTHDSFLKAFNAFPRFLSSDGEMALGAWLYRIATNTTFSHFRRARKIRFSPLLDQHYSQYEEPEEFIDRDAVGQEILEAAQQLSPKNRNAFMMREVHELSYEKIAEVNGNDVVKTGVTQVYRARNGLQTLLSSNKV